MSKCNGRSGKNGSDRKGYKPQKGAPFKKDQFKRSKNTNDFSWWNKYPILIQDAGQFPFNQIQGAEFDLEGYTDGGEPKALPTQMCFTYVPTIGKSVNKDSPFNTQIRNLWLDMHRKYRGIGTYESADLGMFIFCSIDFFADLARAEKIYGYYRNGNAYNRSIPYTMLNAIGVEYDSNSKHLADYRARLNELNQRASNLCLPKGFSAFNDAIVLASATILDSESKRAGMYTFNKGVYYTFSGTVSKFGSCAVAHMRTSSGDAGQTFDDIIADLTAQLEVLWLDSDCQRMGSDILAAYGENGIEKISSIDESYLAPIAKDDIRLLQIHNATICGAPMSGLANVEVGDDQDSTTNPTNLNIYQFDNTALEDLYVCHSDGANNSLELVTELNDWPVRYPSFLTESDADLKIPFMLVPTVVPYLKYNDRIVDTWQDDVTVEQKVEMTRFTVPMRAWRFDLPEGDGAKITPKVGYAIHLEDYGTNVIVGADLWRKTIGSTLDDSVEEPITQVVPWDDISVLAPQTSLFDWHPIRYLAESTADPDTGFYTTAGTEIFGDIDHATVIKDSTKIFYYLHQAAVMSGYKCEVTSTTVNDTLDK